MKKHVGAAIAAAVSALVLTACGGGGGGGGGGAATTGITKVYLFGNMTSTARISSVQTTMTVPSGVMVNYTSPVGATSGVYPLRSGFAQPSGPVRVSAGDITGSYDISGRILTVSLVNNGRVMLKSSTSGNEGKGEEIATINFGLDTPGVIPSSMPLQDVSATISLELPGFNVVPLSGGKTGFSTAFQ